MSRIWRSAGLRVISFMFFKGGEGEVGGGGGCKRVRGCKRFKLSEGVFVINKC